MTASINLTDHFLIAMPALEDSCFDKCLIYVAEHNDHGALGVIVNRPIEMMTLSNLFQRIELPIEVGNVGDLPVFFGGPVQTERGFVLHRPLGKWQATLAINAEIGLTTSRDVLQSAGRAGYPSDMVVALGYSGWAGGQLEYEIGQNAWLTVRADPRILFDLPYEERLASALELLGVGPTNLIMQAGHA
ncbi:MAG: YqgE/AlgH family protein [Candidatus Accumulibacter sp.]|jgi:putative transcriptional regulator|nr:YqgE/AlgH family protein [Accumulibacter sp.]